MLHYTVSTPAGRNSVPSQGRRRTGGGDVEPLHYERSRPRTPRPFWGTGWTKLETVFLFVVFFGAALTDDYLAALGWPRWPRMVGMASACGCRAAGVVTTKRRETNEQGAMTN